MHADFKVGTKKVNPQISFLLHWFLPWYLLSDTLQKAQLFEFRILKPLHPLLQTFLKNRNLSLFFREQKKRFDDKFTVDSNGIVLRFTPARSLVNILWWHWFEARSMTKNDELLFWSNKYDHKLDHKLESALLSPESSPLSFAFQKPTGKTCVANTNFWLKVCSH